MDSKKVIVIGGGPGGYVAAIRSAQLGAKVTLIEKDRIGGTCLNRGCIPTKVLLHDAGLLRSLKRSPVFGPMPLDTTGFMTRMMTRKEQVVADLVKGIELLLESQKVRVIHGPADLTGGGRIEISGGEEQGEILDADAVILAPGSISKAVPGFSPDGEKVITSDEALRLTAVPREIAILGGGYIGVEFAALFNALGSTVTLIEILDDLLIQVEAELVRNLRRVLEREGIRILTRSRVEDLKAVEPGIVLKADTPRGLQEIHTEKLLLAAGRSPNLCFDFRRCGIEVSPSGIRVNSRMETTAPGIYAIGDATGGPLLAHVASEEGVIAAENIMGGNREMDYRFIPACIFTHPEMASVGLTEKEAKEKEGVRIGRFPFRSNPKAVISGEVDGLIKVVSGRESGRILGIHIIGPEASTLISIASGIVGRGGEASEFLHLIQAHPTLPEGLKEAVLDLRGEAIHLPRPLRGVKK